MKFQWSIESMISVDIRERFLWLFAPLMPGGNKSLFTFEQICSF